MENLQTGSENVEMRARSTAPQKSPKGTKASAAKKRVILLVAGLLALAVVALAIWGIYRNSTSAHIDKSKYQAVFLTNGQVYFGKLVRLNSSYMKLSDIFYIQSTAKSETDSENPQEAAAEKTTDVQLIKLGNEVHGPEDAMIIEKNQILFFENLKKDGKVADSIEKYKSEQ